MYRAATVEDKGAPGAKGGAALLGKSRRHSSDNRRAGQAFYRRQTGDDAGPTHPTRRRRSHVGKKPAAYACRVGSPHRVGPSRRHSGSEAARDECSRVSRGLDAEISRQAQSTTARDQLSRRQAAPPSRADAGCARPAWTDARPAHKGQLKPMRAAAPENSGGARRKEAPNEKNDAGPHVGDAVLFRAPRADGLSARR